MAVPTRGSTAFSFTQTRKVSEANSAVQAKPGSGPVLVLQENRLQIAPDDLPLRTVVGAEAVFVVGSDAEERSCHARRKRKGRRENCYFLLHREREACNPT